MTSKDTDPEPRTNSNGGEDERSDPEPRRTKSDGGEPSEARRTASERGDGSGGGGGEAILNGLTDSSGVGKILVGFVVAGVLVYLLGVVAGWGRVINALEQAEYKWVAVACLSSVVGLLAWGRAWQIVLAELDVEVPYRRLSVTYLAATFANYVTPMGQAGGEPFIAYILSKDTEASYEDSLASVVTADLLNLLPFFNFAAIGLVYILLRTPMSEGVETLAQGLAVMAFGVPALVYVGWRRRKGVEKVVLSVVRPVTNYTDRITVAGARRRIEEFYRSLERIAEEPRSLLHALVFSYIGWVFFAMPLYFSGLALDLPITLVLVLFIVPASTLAGLTPLPGGMAGVEAALVILLVALAPIPKGPALAATILYRFASYFFVLGVGGLATFWVIARS
ncbi:MULTISPECIES: lysylphosphatidylglycerol synthase transmembrane domain-containing protein [Halorussus]|uniref:lysylphosphatidylglycerol synthase transmembrane domain-containing protein n=1 Tax=Halorussus TaxID=1070314 RepID=UPI0020A1032B|nr:lysylphosphatidylglycerol synthase transmembrane domain-containing protein [Halorussus vallis]USZ74131.1 flippase-like domain-containing protein [Halorussus vallis]